MDTKHRYDEGAAKCDGEADPGRTRGRRTNDCRRRTGSVIASPDSGKRYALSMPCSTKWNTAAIKVPTAHSDHESIWLMVEPTHTCP